MPALIVAEHTERKRKRTESAINSKAAKSRKAAKLDSGNDIKTKILTIEGDISSGNARSGIEELSTIVQDEGQDLKTVILASAALCRVFSRMIATEQLVKRGDVTTQQAEHVLYLRSAVRTYTQFLQTWIGDSDATKENAAVTMMMRIVKEEVQQEAKRAEQAWRGTSTFVNLISSLLTTADADGARELFVEKYVEEYDDIRYHTLATMKQVLSNDKSQATNALDMLSHSTSIPESSEQLSRWYGTTPDGKHTLLSSPAHKKIAQEAWLAVFRSNLTTENRKTILAMIRNQVLPWFAGRLEILTDFLTDSFNTSGSTAVLALSGIFSLMTQRNIDYPDFYAKLYSLLDEDILHSKHRSQFLRLLDRCLASTHLPAALIASFIKRLARLALQAPPGAIVWMMPWTYNLLRQHPTCMFMLHRTEHPQHAIYATHPKYAETGMRDPFSMTETDPMLTAAIDSSLWELHTLQSHYHPNVATLSSILGEQFTKKEYQLEDFLDHSYATLLDGELSRELKKEPVVEWEIPKRIITTEDGNGLNQIGSMLQAAIEAV